MANLTAKQRIEELQKLIKSKKVDDEEKAMYAMQILAIREAVNAERGGKNLDAQVTPELLRQAENRAKDLNRELYYALQINDPSYEKAGMKAFQKYIFSNATKGHGGQMMENYNMIMRKKLNFETREEALPEDMDVRRMPTAKERIEVLQQQLRIEGFDIGEDNRRRCLAGILAARESVGAVRGGKNLKNTIPDAKRFNRQAAEFDLKLSVLDEKEMEKLNQLAIKGHGGEMKEFVDGIFKSPEFQNKFKAEMDRQRSKLVDRRLKAVATVLRDPPKGRNDRESELIMDSLISDMLYIRFVGDKGMSPQDTREALNSDVGRFVSTQEIMKTEEFKIFKEQLSKKPEIMEKVKQGNVKALFDTFDLAAKQVFDQQAQQSKKTESPTVQQTTPQKDVQASL